MDAAGRHIAVTATACIAARGRTVACASWEDQASLDAFATSDPHRAITRWLQPLMGQARFEFFQIPGSDLPMTWDQMKAPMRSHRSPDSTR